MKKSIKNLEAKSLGGFKKTFGKKIFGGGCPTWTIKDIVIKPNSLSSSDDDVTKDGDNDGPC